MKERGRQPREKKLSIKKVYNSFVEYDRIVVPLKQGGEFVIVMKVNDIRVFKIEYLLNGISIKPENVQGKNLAAQRWAEIKISLFENSDSYLSLNEPNKEE